MGVRSSPAWILGAGASMALAVGCHHRIDSRMVAGLGPDLGRLARAVDALELDVDSNEDSKKGASEKDSDTLLAEAVAHDPALLEPFDGLTVRVQVEDGFGVVLVCDREGRLALLEDAGCTARLDRNHWEAAAEALCSFSLRPRDVCAEPTSINPVP